MSNILSRILRWGCVALILSAGILSADAASLTKVIVNGQEFYVYEVKKGDTMYGVSHSFGWDSTTLQQYNPGALSPLVKGSMLYYPISTSTMSGEGKFTTTSTSGTPSELSAKEIKHYVKKGETLSSISRMYGVDLSTLYKLNPGSKDGIKADTWLLISKGEKSSKIAKDTYHTIEKGETLYGVAKANNVSIEALMKANPGLSDTHFRAGDVIRIPASGTGIVMVKEKVSEKQLSGFKPYKIARNDTWESIAQRYGISVDDLKAANKSLEFKRNQYIGIPINSNVEVEREVAQTDPREESPEGIQDIYESINGISDDSQHKEVRVAIVVTDPSERKDKEYLRGFLTCVDRLKNSTYKIILKVLDGKDSSVSNIDALDAFKPTIVFTTTDNSIPTWLSQYAETSRTPLVNTLDVKDEQYQVNPYMIQLITPSDYFNDEVASWFKENYDGYTLVFTGDKDSNDALADALMEKWEPHMVRSRSVEDLRKMPLAESGKYLIYSYETKRNEVKDFLSAVENACEREPLARVSVIGRPNWILYDESLSEALGNNNVMIPSRFYMPKDENSSSRFNVEYRQLFDTTPQKSFPVYAAVGYDTANYFLSQLGGNGGDINDLTEYNDGIQSDYSLQRMSNWSGMVNRLVYIVKFQPYGGAEKIKIK